MIPGSHQAPLHIETPLLESTRLSHLSNRRVWLKMEALQPPGSFKIRGIGLACTEHVRAGAARLISSSGGNAGLAVAYAGHRLGVPVTVVVPQTTSERARELIAAENAKVIVHGASWQEANALATSLVDSKSAFIHPFDDPLLWRGHATIIDEASRGGPRPDAVVLSVGGGGLLCGVLEGLHRNHWHDVTVIAVETDGADSFARSVQARERVELPGITSVATSLGARQVCQTAFEWTQRHRVISLTVSDREAVEASLRFIDDHRVLTEPACGASLAVVYQRHAALEEFGTVLVIVCGGATTTLHQLQRWLAR